MQCTLCGSETILYSEIQEKKFFTCKECKAILLHPSYFLSAEEEKKRYQLHQNDINNLGYQKFVSPIVNTIYNDYDNTHIGLDFGSGSGPVITSLLTKKGYNVMTYDPFFDPNNTVLNNTYDFIICCEVMEHFYHPFKEFKLLSSLLNSKGSLYCKTSLYTQTIDFKSWWYKNDPTHVFFYSKDTLFWVKNRFKFKQLEIKEDLIVFKN